MVWGTSRIRALTFSTKISRSKRRQFHPILLQKRGKHEGNPYFYNKYEDEERINSLVTVFNHPDMYKEYNITQDSRRGLFGIRDMIKPLDMLSVVDKVTTVVEKERLNISQILREDLNLENSIDILDSMDNISEAICGGIDPAMLCTSVHEDVIWREIAREVFMKLSALINTLNTDKELAHCLEHIVGNEEIFGGLTEEQQEVSKHLLNEFRSYAVFHSKEIEEKEELFYFQNKILELSLQYEENLEEREESYPDVKLPGGSLDNLNLNQLMCEDPEEEEVIKPIGPILPYLLHNIKDEKLRRMIFNGNRQFSPENIRILNEIVAERNRMSRLLGKSSFAELTLDTRSSIKCPEKVIDFLMQLAKLIDPAVVKEIKYLKELRSRDRNISSELPLSDLDYYLYNMSSRPKRPSAVFFTLGNCLKGLDNLVTKLFGLRLHLSPMSEHESWHSSILRVEVQNEDCQIVGVIYFDLFGRPNKTGGASNYTICFSTTRNNKIPHVALVTSLTDSFELKKTGKPVFLSFPEVSTIFHEFGHALNTILSKTEYQHLAGVRSPIDFVETPSTLMEHFCRDYRVVRTFAEHYQTKEVISEEKLRDIVLSYEKFRALETKWSIVLALFDLKMHMGDEDSLSLFHDILDEHFEIKHDKDTWWFTRWSHIVNYASSYYTYLKCNANSAAIWKECFSESPFDRSAGEKLKTEILSKGGSINPQTMLRNMIGKDVCIHHFTNMICNTSSFSFK